MLSKEERKAHNNLFWGDFRKYMQPYRSASGRKTDWSSYPTKIKYIFLRLEATSKYVALNFDIQAKDEGVRAIIWEQMGELKNVLTNAMNGDSGEWIEQTYNPIVGDFSRIQWKLDGVNYNNPSDKEKIFSFFKEKLLGFDEFYNDFSEILILLAK
ncbi:MAG TPA: DUF4268 domain-containing protein [Crocinitomicaceae bacterium]|nr:DUF4268 domain-containing protein [Crocinitomicaceae bacterium]